MIPYSAEVFLAVLAEYNAAIWPAQAVAWIFGAVIVVLAVWPVAGSGRLTAAVLAAAWAVTGSVYHLSHFADIDFWAYGFAALFIVQAMLLAWAAMAGTRLDIRFHGSAAGWTGLAIALYGLAVYPAAGLLLGRAPDEISMFGITPAPTVIVTLGLMLLVRPFPSWHLLVLPISWCVIGGAVALELPLPEDLVLVAVGAASLAVRVLK